MLSFLLFYAFTSGKRLRGTWAAVHRGLVGSGPYQLQS